MYYKLCVWNIYETDIYLPENLLHNVCKYSIGNVQIDLLPKEQNITYITYSHNFRQVRFGM